MVLFKSTNASLQPQVQCLHIFAWLIRSPGWCDGQPQLTATVAGTLQGRSNPEHI